MSRQDKARAKAADSIRDAFKALSDRERIAWAQRSGLTDADRLDAPRPIELWGDFGRACTIPESMAASDPQLTPDGWQCASVALETEDGRETSAVIPLIVLTVQIDDGETNAIQIAVFAEHVVEQVAAASRARAPEATSRKQAGPRRGPRPSPRPRKAAPTGNGKRIDALLDRADVLIFDTETTGFSRNSQIVQIAIINTKGETVLNTLAKPKGKIPADATEVHGITNEDIADAPAWPEVWETVQGILASAKAVLAWNADYDMRLLDQTCTKHAIAFAPDFRMPPVGCAMRGYAATLGKKRIGLGKAYERVHGKPLENAHGALPDAQATLAMLRAVGHGEGPTIELERDVAFEQLPSANGTALAGKRIAVTGTLESLCRRGEIERFCRYLGATVTPTLTRKNDFLLVCDEAGKTKLAKAAKDGTAILHWNELAETLVRKDGIAA